MPTPKPQTCRRYRLVDSAGIMENLAFEQLWDIIQPISDVGINRILDLGPGQEIECEGYVIRRTT